MSIFCPADMLIPKEEYLNHWPVIACDQFTSDSSYWDRVRSQVSESPSTVNMIIPESDLKRVTDIDSKVQSVVSHMRKYENDQIYRIFKNSLVYVERTLINGSIRKGVIGCIDLKYYDFSRNSQSPIRATEETVVDRLPPRIKIREKAIVELPHTILFCNDEKRSVIEYLTERKSFMKKIYDLDLIENGGHVEGWILDCESQDKFLRKISDYELNHKELSYIVGDGNHSLAAAKYYYDKTGINGDCLQRYALVELENLYDESIVFEPIHRVVTNCDCKKLTEYLKKSSDKSGESVELICSKGSESVKFNSRLVVGKVQKLIDEFLTNNSGYIDYIHDKEFLVNSLKSNDSLGIILPEIDKDSIFSFIVKTNHTLPRKTFSVGHSTEKRYYLECRRIRQD